MQKSLQRYQKTSTGKRVLTAWKLAAIAALAVLLYGFLIYADLNNLAAKRDYQAQRLQAVPVEQVISGLPARLSVPSLSIDLAVMPGRYDVASHTWDLSDDHAQYAVISPPVNTKGGKTFIYGHNVNKVFGNLQNLKVGEQAIITTDKNDKFYYVLRSSVDVAPDDVGQLTYSGPPALTLQTCSGNWDEMRRLFTLDLLRVEDQV